MPLLSSINIKRSEVKLKKVYQNYSVHKLTLWRPIFLVSIICNYFVATFSYIFQKEVSRKIYYVILILDIIYVVNYVAGILNFCWKKSKSSLRRTRSKLVLMIDLLLAFPYSYVYEAFALSYNYHTFLWLRSILIVRLFHLVSYFKQWTPIGVDHIKYFVFQYLLFLIVIMHLGACVFYLSLYNFQNHSLSEKYFVCTYYSITIILNRSFGDVTPETTIQKIVQAIFIATGFLATTGIFIGSLSFLLNIKYKRKIQLRLDLQSLLAVFRSVSIRELLIKYYRLLWQKKEGVSKVKDSSFLPQSLKHKICIDMTIDFIQSCNLFHGKSDTFLSMVAFLIKYEFYEEGEFIFQRNVAKNKMIFVTSGVIQILSDEDDESPIISLGRGTCLGESSLILSIPAKCSVRTASYTELQVLKRKDLFTLIGYFPEDFVAMSSEIKERIFAAESDISIQEREIELSGFFQKRSNASTKIIKEALKDADKSKFKFLRMCQLFEGQLPQKNQLCVSQAFPWIFVPKNTVTKLWKVFLIVIILFISVAYPHYIIFTKRYPSWFSFISDLIDVFLTIDVVIILMTAIEENNKLISTFTEICQKRLMQFGFYLDFVSAIKLELFYWIWSSNKRYSEILRLNRLLKFYRIPKLMRYAENKIEIDPSIVTITKYILYLLRFVYWGAAFFYLTTCFDTLCSEYGWFFTKLMRDLQKQIRKPYTDHIVLTSSYFSLSCLTGFTAGDILPVTITDMLTTSLMLFLGLFTFNCCVSQATTIFTRQYKKRKRFRNIMSATLTYIESKTLDWEIFERVKNYFLVQWYYDKNAVLEDRIVINANEIFKTKITSEEKLEIIQSVPLFRGLNSNFLLLLAMESKILMLPPNEFITYRGEILNIIYIIIDGFCLRQFEGNSVVIGPRSFFGSMCLFCNVNSLCTVETLTHVKALYITEDLFWKAASQYPAVVTQFKKTSRNFDIISEFKRIPIYTNVIDSLDENLVLDGSFVFVVSYCYQRRENYGEPFNSLGPLCWLKLFLIPVCILPYGLFLKCWYTIRLGVALLVAIFTPFRIIGTENFVSLNHFLLTLDFFTYVDLYVMMLVGYYEDKNQLVFHPFKTAVHYLKGKFLIDALFCFPFEIPLSYIYSDEKLSNLYRLDNIMKIFRMGQFYRLWQTLNYANRKPRKINFNVLHILKYFMGVVFLIQLWTTILIVTNCKRESEKIVFYNETVNETIPLSLRCNKNSWIDRSNFQNFTRPYQIYVLGSYFCTQILTMTGFGDITPTSFTTLITVMLILTCGIFITGYIFVHVACMKSHFKCKLYKYQSMINEIQHFMREEKVSEKLQQQVFSRLQYKFTRNEFVTPCEVLAKLPPSLHADVNYSLFIKTLRKAPIFQNLDTAFLRILSRMIKQRYYLRKETIFHNDEVVGELCILEEGVLRVISSITHREIYMEVGGIFGNLTPNAKHKISSTIVAVSDVEILVLDSWEFYDVLKQSPSIRNIVIQNWTKRTDFILPIADSETSMESKSYPEATPSVITFRSLLEFKANILALVLICLPWKLFRISIPHYAAIFIFFDIYQLILTYTNAVFTIYEFTFQDHPLWLILFTAQTDFIFIVKVLLDLHKTYENEFGEIITANNKIIRRYFEWQTLRKMIDLLVNFPFYYLIFFATIFAEFDTYLYFSIFRLFTLFRLINIANFNEKVSKHFIPHRLIQILCDIILWSFLIIHVLACGWYLFACPLSYCYENSWVTTTFNKTSIEKSDAYFASVYFVVTVTTRTGTGDIIAINIKEQIYIIMMMILSIFLIALLIGRIWNFLNSMTASRRKFESQLNELSKFCKNNEISKYQKNILWKYIQQLWINCGGQQMPKAISYLHSATVQEMLSEIYGPHLRKSFIFAEVQEPFIHQVCQYLKREVFFPGDFIVHHGEFNNTMYFIHCGQVDIMTIHSNLTETIHEILSSGDMFGTIQGLYYNIPHHFSYRARTLVHVVGLQFDDWEYLLDFFPQSREVIFMKTNRITV